MLISIEIIKNHINLHLLSLKNYDVILHCYIADILVLVILCSLIFIFSLQIEEMLKSKL